MDPREDLIVEAHDDIDKQIIADLQAEAGQDPAPKTESEPKKDVIEEEPEQKPATIDDKEKDKSNLDDDKSGKNQDLKKSDKSIPLPTYLEDKKVWKEREAALLQQLAEAKQQVETKKDSVDLDKKIQDYADKMGYDFDTAKEQFEIFNAILAPINEKLATVDEIRADRAKEIEERKQADLLAAQEPAFNQDFDATVLPIIESSFPTATKAQINEARKLLKDRAFGEDVDQKLKYIFLGNEDIQKIFSKETKPRQVEGGHKVGAVDDGDDFINMSEEEAVNLPDDKFEQWNAAQEGKSKRHTIYSPRGEKLN